jgi:prepilin-type processing-associated H-X9-DG protein
MILPNLERKDIFLQAESGASCGQSRLEIYNCPSSPSSTLNGNPIAYAGNCGSTSQAKGDGVMLDTFSNARISLDYVSSGDGCASTLLFSERCGPLVTSLPNWNGNTTVTISGTAGWNSGDLTTWPIESQNTGVSYTSGVKYLGNSQTPLGFIVTGAIAGRVLNGGGPPPATPTNERFSFPNSSHTSGVMASFCDGHIKFISDAVAADVYSQLMTSNTAAASVTGLSILNEGDY